MKSQSIEILFVLIALLAAAVSIAAVDMNGDLSASNSVDAKPGSYPPPAVVAAPPQFPWWKMPLLPEQSYRIKVPPVFVLPDPYPAPERP